MKDKLRTIGYILIISYVDINKVFEGSEGGRLNFKASGSNLILNFIFHTSLSLMISYCSSEDGILLPCWSWYIIMITYIAEILIICYDDIYY